MDRRLLLKLMAASAAVGITVPLSGAASPRVVVAGAGIIGASIAYHLAKLGAAVTVIDAVGPASHASRGTLAWINATWAKQPRSYHAFNQEGVAGWSTLAQDVGIPIVQNGSLEWFESPSRQDRLAEQIKEQVAWGEPARMISGAELEGMEPNVDFTDTPSAAFSPNDAAVDPVLATELLLDAAKRMGAKVVYPCNLNSITTLNGALRAVETSHGSIRADKLVMATGAAPGIIERITGTPLPQRTTPGVIVITKPMKPVVNRIIAGPGGHLHQRLDGRIVLGEQMGAPETEAHTARLAGRPNSFPNRAIAAEHAARVISLSAAFVPDMADAEVEDTFIGWRPLPLDGHPVLGASTQQKDVHIAITHSGVTLAPIIGALTAHEVLKGERIKRLNPYRPDRDFMSVKRY